MISINTIVLVTLVPAIMALMCRWTQYFLKNQNENLRRVFIFLMTLLERYSMATWITTFPLILYHRRFDDWLWVVALVAWIINFITAKPYFKVEKNEYHAGYNWKLNIMTIVMYAYLICILTLP